MRSRLRGAQRSLRCFRVVTFAGRSTIVAKWLNHCTIGPLRRAGAKGPRLATSKGMKLGTTVMALGLVATLGGTGLARADEGAQDRGRVSVRVDISDVDEADLFLQGEDRREKLCALPCATQVAPGAELVIVARGMTKRFEVPHRPGEHVDIVVTPKHSRGYETTAAWLFGGGIVHALVGTGLVIVAPIFGRAENRDTNVRIAGAVTIGTGVVLITTAILLLADRGLTTAERAVDRPARPLPIRPGADDASSAPMPRVPSSPTAIFPLELGLRF
ncbi:MAG: hypothetical protein JST00_21575 [Deltaproteobacteria bacterium]|nr:hypothetical protein [Deltaproteobacteria bacterium]